MSSDFLQRADRWARNTTPFGLTLTLIIIGVLPLHIPEYAAIAPVFAVTSVYHWGVYRPHLLPSLAVFVLGLVQDVLSGTPIGLYAVVFLSLYGVCVFQRQFLVGKSFLVYWMGFGLIWFVASIELWALSSAWHLALLDIKGFVFQYLLTVGLFPFIAWIFLRWQQAFLQQD